MNFATKHKMVVVVCAGALAVALIAIFGVSVAIEHARSRAVAASDAAEASAQAERQKTQDAQDAEDAAKKSRVESLNRSIYNGETTIASAKDLLVSASSYGVGSAMSEVERLILEVSASIELASTPDIVNSTELLEDAMEAVGTPEDAKGRKLLAKMTSDDRDYYEDDLDAAIEDAHAYCDETLDGYSKSEAIQYLVEEYDVNAAAISVYCPKFLPALKAANFAFTDGDWAVGSKPSGLAGSGNKIAAGKYKTIGGVADCYWERNDGSGRILENNFIGSAYKGVSVTIHKGEGFSTSGCGVWVRK